MTASQSLQGEPPAPSGNSEFGLHGQRFVEVDQSLREFAKLEIADAAAVERLSIGGVDPEGLREIADGFHVASIVEVDPAPFLECKGRTGVGRQSSRERFDRLPPFSDIAIGKPQIVESDDVGRIQPDGFLQIGQGLGRPAQLTQDAAASVQRHLVVGIDLQCGFEVPERGLELVHPIQSHPAVAQVGRGPGVQPNGLGVVGYGLRVPSLQAPGEPAIVPCRVITRRLLNRPAECLLGLQVLALGQQLLASLLDPHGQPAPAAAGDRGRSSAPDVFETALRAGTPEDQPVSICEEARRETLPFAFVRSARDVDLGAVRSDDVLERARQTTGTKTAAFDLQRTACRQGAPGIEAPIPVGRPPPLVLGGRHLGTAQEQNQNGAGQAELGHGPRDWPSGVGREAWHLIGRSCHPRLKGRGPRLRRIVRIPCPSQAKASVALDIVDEFLTGPAQIARMREPTPSDVAIGLWLEALSAERGTAASSLEVYRTSARCWADFLATRGSAIESASRTDFTEYLAYLDARHLSEATIAHRRTVVRSLHRFLMAEEQVGHDPTSLVAPMKRPERLPLVLTISEVDRLLETAHALARDDTVGLYRQAGYARRAALFEVLYASGMRVSEAVNLPAAAVAPGAKSMVVRGKGGKDRLVMLHQRAIEAVEVWRELAAAYGSVSETWLFHAVRDGAAPLTRQSALAEIKAAAVAAGIRNPDRVSPHKLRHAFASHLLSNGADLRSIQELLGHADLGTTEIYLHTDTRRTHGMVRDLHPLNDPAGGRSLEEA